VTMSSEFGAAGFIATPGLSIHCHTARTRAYCQSVIAATADDDDDDDDDDCHAATITESTAELDMGHL